MVEHATGKRAEQDWDAWQKQANRRRLITFLNCRQWGHKWIANKGRMICASCEFYQDELDEDGWPKEDDDGT